MPNPTELSQPLKIIKVIYLICQFVNCTVPGLIIECDEVFYDLSAPGVQGGPCVRVTQFMVPYQLIPDPVQGAQQDLTQDHTLAVDVLTHNIN